MASKKSWSMPPPPKPAKRTWAPGLAPRMHLIDPYDPEGRDISGEYKYLLSKVEDEPVQGTWTSIDSDTGTRQWDQTFQQQQSNQKSERSSSRSYPKPASDTGNIWDRWVQPVQDLTDTSSVRSRSSVLSTASTDDSGSEVDQDVSRHFVNVTDIMTDQPRQRTKFELRNRSSLVVGNASIIKNIIGGNVVSICHQPVDDRVQYRDEDGNYIDGIDRGKMKKRYEEEWKRRLADRKAEIEHITKLKNAWEALSPSEQARRTAQRVSNSKLLMVLGAGLDATRDLSTYEGEDLPEIYRRVSRLRWSISEHGSVIDNQRSRTLPSDSTPRQSTTRQTEQGSVHSTYRQHYGSASSTSTTSIIRKISSEPDYIPLDSEDTSEINNDNTYSAQGTSSISNAGKSQDHSSSISDWFGDNRCGNRAYDTCVDYEENAYRRSWEPKERHKASTPGKRKRTPSDLAPRPFIPSTKSQSPTSLTPKARALTLRPPTLSSKASPSVATEVQSVEYTPDLLIFEDLPKRDRFDGSWGKEWYFDSVKAASNKTGRVVTVRLHEPVHFTSSAVCERLFFGKVQAIQYHPAERLALVVFVFPAEATVFVRHVTNLRENDRHEYRRLQIDAEWYKGSEADAIYPAQVNTLAAVISEDLSRVFLVNHVSTGKRAQDFAHDMKISFPDKIIVKAAISKPIKRYVQARDGNAGILEFASIMLAYEVMERFKAKSVTGYEQSTVEWLSDSCDTYKPSLPFCDCLNCGGKVLKDTSATSSVNPG
ncbi:hypothetical protein MMC13_006790 [Lambiella insularis]|nr:hypothetical protein [Lambiella insularis]